MGAAAGTGLIVRGVKHAVPGLRVVNYEDDPRLKLKIPEDGIHKWTTKTGVVLHTTKGVPGGKDKRPQLIKPGLRADDDFGDAIVDMWSTDGRCAGAHLGVGHNAVVYQFADLADVTWHATTVNYSTIGIEYHQGADAELYTGQIAAGVQLSLFLTTLDEHGIVIARQMPDKYRGPLARLAHGARDFSGVFGHRDQTDNRGEGDPGDAIMDAHARAGFERRDLRALGTLPEDRRAWRTIQHEIGRVTPDGIPGPATARRLRAVGRSIAHPYMPERTAAA